MSLFDIIKKNAKKFPNKKALIFNNYEYTYKEVLDLIIQAIHNLEKNNFKKNDIVLIIEDNTLPHIISLFALSYINCTVVPSGTYYSNSHLSNIISLTKCSAIIGPGKLCNFFKKKFRIKKFLTTNKSKKFSFFFLNSNKKNLKNKKIDKNKNFIITFSSGSTANPKPIIFSQKTKIIRHFLFKKLYKITSKDKFIVTSPIDHSLGMRTLFVPLLTGATCVVMHKFNLDQYVYLIKKHQITFSVLISNQIHDLAKNKKLFKNFFISKGLISASTKLFNSVKNQILKKKINLYEMYGAAEIGTVTSINLLKNKKKFNSVGKSYQKNINIKIISENGKFLTYNQPGEIVCKTPGRFKGYLKFKPNNNLSHVNGYFKTGDIGYLDKDKYLYFVSRKKNIIRRSGITIYPEDIEKVFFNNKKIREVAVIGVERKNYSKIFLFINKVKNINESYIKNLCLTKLSTFQLPDKIIFLNKFPKTNLGKINKKKLLDLAT